VVLHFPVITFTPIVLHWSSFFRSSIFSEPIIGLSYRYLFTVGVRRRRCLKQLIAWLSYPLLLWWRWPEVEIWRLVTGAIQCYSCKATAPNEIEANVRCLETANLEDCSEFYEYYRFAVDIFIV